MRLTCMGLCVAYVSRQRDADLIMFPSKEQYLLLQTEKYDAQSLFPLKDD